MKYISILIFVALMAWTWSLASTSHMPNLLKNKGHEADIEEAIRTQIQGQNPAVTDIVFRQLYTEVVRENAEVNVHFVYEFTEPLKTGDVTAQLMKGSVKGLSADGGETWTWALQGITSPQVRFENGSKISTKDQLPETNASPAPGASGSEPESANPSSHQGHEGHPQ